MLDNINWLGHSTIKISENKIIYIDPYNIKENFNDADIIFITHNHYDHFSKEDLKKCVNPNTKIVITEDLYDEVLQLGFNNNTILTVLPNNNYDIDNITFSTVPAYNIDKQFHSKESNWVGYILNIKNTIYYIAGDTDITDEARKVKCDVAFLPVGGTYTMDYKEASDLANKIKPKIAIPIHYGSIVGTKEDALKFKSNLNSNIECIIL